jgi:uncharacterized protein YjbK
MSEENNNNTDTQQEDQQAKQKEEHNFRNFKILDSLDVNQIIKLLENESRQFKALVLTFLPKQRAKKVLEKMNVEEKDAILDRISRIKVINLDVVSQIEEMLEDDVKNRIRKLLTVNGKSLSQGLKEEIGEATVGRVTEKEKKFLVDNQEKFQVLVSSKTILGNEIKDKSVKRRHYIYFDTKDLYLYKNNITYSVRDRVKDYFITLKLPVDSGILERDEYNASVSKQDNTFDISIHQNNSVLVPVKLIKEIVDDEELIISAKFRVTSTRYRIELEKEQPVEISFDRVTLEGKQDTDLVQLYEIEVENKGADDRLFLTFCKGFQRETGLKEIDRSKYQRVIDEYNKKPNV